MSQWNNCFYFTGWNTGFYFTWNLIISWASMSWYNLQHQTIKNLVEGSQYFVVKEGENNLHYKCNILEDFGQGKNKS